jgi:iron complex transport system substrate-binding protein
MRKNSIKLLFIGFLFLFLGCNTSKTKGADATIGKSRYSQWLSYTKTELGIKLFIKDPDRKAATRVILCTTHPEQVKSMSTTTEVLDINNMKLATNAATHVGMLASLNARDCIGAVSLAKYLHDPTLKKRFNKGQLLELGGTSIPFESLSKKHINVWVSAGMEPLDQANEERFKALGIQYFPNYDWREEHPLGKAEWLLFSGQLLIVLMKPIFSLRPSVNDIINLMSFPKEIHAKRYWWVTLRETIGILPCKIVFKHVFLIK